MEYVNHSPSQLRAIIDQAVNGDPQKRSTWSEMLSEAMIGKKYKVLTDLLSHGKGFNDKSKIAFCEAIGVKPVLSMKGIDLIIAQYCQIPLERMLAERKLSKLKRVLATKEKLLTESFSNGPEIVEWVKNLVSNGYVAIKTQNNKSYLANETGAGYDLVRTAIKNYAVALTEYTMFTKTYL